MWTGCKPTRTSKTPPPERAATRQVGHKFLRLHGLVHADLQGHERAVEITIAQIAQLGRVLIANRRRLESRPAFDLGVLIQLLHARCHADLAFGARGVEQPFAGVDVVDNESRRQAAAAFRFRDEGFGGQVMRSLTGANGSWGLVDAPLEPFIENTAVAFASAANLYVWDSYGTGNAFSAPLSSIQSTGMIGRKPAMSPVTKGERHQSLRS
jgi:hypothetical protein